MRKDDNRLLLWKRCTDTNFFAVSYTVSLSNKQFVFPLNNIKLRGLFKTWSVGKHVNFRGKAGKQAYVIIILIITKYCSVYFRNSSRRREAVVCYEFPNRNDADNSCILGCTVLLMENIENKTKKLRSNAD